MWICQSVACTTKNTLFTQNFYCLSPLTQSNLMHGQTHWIFVHKTHTHTHSDTVHYSIFPLFFLLKSSLAVGPHLWGLGSPPLTVSVLVSLLWRSWTPSQWAPLAQQSNLLFALWRNYCKKTAPIPETINKDQRQSWADSLFKAKSSAFHMKGLYESQTWTHTHFLNFCSNFSDFQVLPVPYSMSITLFLLFVF